MITALNPKIMSRKGCYFGYLRSLGKHEALHGKERGPEPDPSGAAAPAASQAKAAAAAGFCWKLEQQLCSRVEDLYPFEVFMILSRNKK